MTERDPPELSARALILRIARVYMAPRWLGWLTALIAAVVGAYCSTELIRLLKPAVDQLMIVHSRRDLLILPLTLAAYALGRAAAGVIQAALINRIGNAVVGDVQVQLFGKLVRADLARLRDQHSGAFVSSVIYDSGLIREAATSGVVNYTLNLLQVVGAAVIMLSIDYTLAAAVVAAALPASWIMRRFSKLTRKAARGAMTETSALSSAIM